MAAPKTATILLVLGLLGLLAVSGCLAEPRPQPDGVGMIARGGAGSRQLLNYRGHGEQRDGGRYEGGWYCWYEGERYEPYAYYRGCYCCQGGQWSSHKCS